MVLLAAAGCASPIAPADRERRPAASAPAASAPAASAPAVPATGRLPATERGGADGERAYRPGEGLPAAPAARRVNCRRIKCVALTFDDGPGPYTRPLLDVLARHRARATFFVLGRMVVDDGPGTVRRMVAEGHELGNHSWSHPVLSELSRARIRWQLLRTQLVVEQATGVRMTVMRPPYGATDLRVTAESRRQGLAQVLWNVDTLDWRDRKVSVVVRRAARIRPGSIVLLHDIHPSTVTAVPRLLRRLAARGYTFVTLSELYGGRPLKPGRKYYNRG
ncbi:polysaccharide deacetylase family protein [Streptosporangium fragile]